MKSLVMLAPYGASLSFWLSLNDPGTGGYKASPTIASGDFKIAKSGGAEANLGTLPAVDGTNTKQVNFVLSDTELTTARVRVRGEDQTTPADWEPVEIVIETYGNASAAHPNLGNVAGSPSGQYFTPVYRNTDDTGAIYFEWPTSAGSITVTRSTNGGAYAANTGTASYLRQDGNVYMWQLAYNAADRPASGSVVYKLTDGTTERYLPLFMEPDIPAIKTKTDYLPSATAGAAGGVFIAGSNAATSVNITGNITGSLSGSVGSVTGAVGSVTGSVGSIASGGISSASFAAGAIDASAIATDAFGALELAAGAASEIAAAVWDLATSGHTTSGTFGEAATVIPTAAQNADALLDRTNSIETGWTPRKVLRIMAAALGGKVSGAATTVVTFRDVTDTKDRIVATVDADGNRSSVTLDGS